MISQNYCCYSATFWNIPLFPMHVARIVYIFLLILFHQHSPMCSFCIFVDFQVALAIGSTLQGLLALVMMTNIDHEPWRWLLHLSALPLLVILPTFSVSISNVDWYIIYYLKLWPVLYKFRVLSSGWDRVYYNEIKCTVYCSSCTTTIRIHH